MAISSWIVLCSLLASVAVVAATALLFLPKHSPTGTASLILSFAVGTLLSSAFLGLLPRALAGGPPGRVLATVLVGMLSFFALEKLVIWRHCHVKGCIVHGVSGPLILIGDAFHNLVDGVMIATAFLASVPTGIAVTLAVIAHEIPQEVGDFGMLLHSGYSRKRAFALNSLSAATTPVGALIGYLTLSTFQQWVPYLLAFSAASFLYIGTADLIPGLQQETRPRVAITQFACLLLGVTVIAVLRAGIAPE